MARLSWSYRRCSWTFRCDHSVKPSRRKYPKRIRELIARKRCLWCYHKRDPDNHIYADSYRDAAKDCSKAITDYELGLEKQTFDSGSSGQFFKYINSKLGRSHNTGILKDKSGSNVMSDAQKANLLNSLFSSVNVTDNSVLTAIPSNQECVKMRNWKIFIFTRYLG